MEQGIAAIRDNLTRASLSSKMSDAVVLSQIEELVRLVSWDKANVRYADKYFKKAFDMPLLSSEYLAFCVALFSEGFAADDSRSGFDRAYSVSCMHNEYCDSAFELICGVLPLEKEYESDFNSVCEAVYSKRCSCALLPLYNTRDGLIVSLYKLIQKYDLHVSASARVLMADGNTETEFFLVSAKEMPAVGLCSRLLLSVTHYADSTIASLLSAFSDCGIVARYINTLPIHYNDDKTESVLILDIESAPVGAVRLFLKTALPYSTVVGVYSIVK